MGDYGIFFGLIVVVVVPFIVFLLHYNGNSKQFRNREVIESYLHNTPLSSGEQITIFIFSLLMIPTVFIFVGIVPILIFGFGIFLMKKNKDFAAIQTAVKIVKYLLNAGIFALGMMIVYSAYFSFTNEYSRSRELGNVLVFSIALFITIVYYIIINKMFYNILEKHQQWVSENGIFSKTPKVENQGKDGEFSIIKGEKFKQFSVADELIKWSQLKENGHITEEEFNEVREKLLKKT